MLCDSREGWDGVGSEREVQERGDTYTPVADSRCCMAHNTGCIVFIV